MKKTNYLIALLFYFITFPPFASGQTEAKIPKPPIPISMAGQHAVSLEEAGRLLEKGELKAFYLLKINNQINGERNKRTKAREQRYMREDSAAEEWMYYYMACAPFIDPKGGHSGLDISAKRMLMPRFNSILVRKKAEMLSVDSEKLKALECTYAVILMKSLRDFHALARKNTAEVNGILWKRRYCRELGIKRDEINRAKADEFRYRETLSHLSAYNLHRVGEGLVENLVHAFPKNGATVREYLKKAGYSASLECAWILQKAVGRSPENKYLYEGLANEKEVEKEVGPYTFGELKAYEQRTKEEKAWESLRAREEMGREGKAVWSFFKVVGKIITEEDNEQRKQIVAEAEKQLNAAIPKIMEKSIYQMTDDDEKTVLFTYTKILSDVTDRFIKEADSKLDAATLKAKEEKRARGYALFARPAEYLHR